MSAWLIILSPAKDSESDKILECDIKASTFDIIQHRKRATHFKLGKLWVFKYFFGNKEIFKALAEKRNVDKFRFEFKTPVFEDLSLFRLGNLEVKDTKYLGSSRIAWVL